MLKKKREKEKRERKKRNSKVEKSKKIQAGWAGELNAFHHLGNQSLVAVTQYVRAVHTYISTDLST